MILDWKELADYSEGERAKWLAWLREQPPAVLEVAVQPGGRFPAVWDLLDHIFLVEARHTSRILGEPPPAATGIPRGDLEGLFRYAGAAREKLRLAALGLSHEELRRVREFPFGGVVHRLSPRKLLFHILLHETRHLAQVAAAVRNAGYPPPGEHDLFYSSALQ